MRRPLFVLPAAECCTAHNRRFRDAHPARRSSDSRIIIYILSRIIRIRRAMVVYSVRHNVIYVFPERARAYSSFTIFFFFLSFFFYDVFVRLRSPRAPFRMPRRGGLCFAKKTTTTLCSMSLCACKSIYLLKPHSRTKTNPITFRPQLKRKRMLRTTCCTRDDVAHRIFHAWTRREARRCFQTLAPDQQ